jgi:hypothetical protein
VVTTGSLEALLGAVYSHWGTPVVTAYSVDPDTTYTSCPTPMQGAPVLPVICTLCVTAPSINRRPSRAAVVGTYSRPSTPIAGVAVTGLVPGDTQYTAPVPTSTATTVPLWEPR